MVECADWWGPNSILKLKDPADCSHVTYELDKISMSGTLPPAAISTSPSRSPTLAPISKSTSPTQVPITGKPTASHMCASPGSNCFIKQKGEGKGCDDESCVNLKQNAVIKSGTKSVQSQQLKNVIYVHVVKML